MTREYWPTATYAHVITRRPAGYAADLDRCIVERDAGGFWVDHDLPAWGELVAKYAKATPPAKPRSIAEWPLAARIIARARQPQDAGVGDTLERLLAHRGGDLYKRWYKRIVGRDCKCSDRQASLNQMFRYPPGAPAAQTESPKT